MIAPFHPPSLSSLPNTTYPHCHLHRSLPGKLTLVISRNSSIYQIDVAVQNISPGNWLKYISHLAPPRSSTFFLSFVHTLPLNGLPSLQLHPILALYIWVRPSSLRVYNQKTIFFYILLVLRSWGLNPVNIWHSGLRDHHSKWASSQTAKGHPIPSDCYHPSVFETGIV